jgi:hypothetical protein
MRTAWFLVALTALPAGAAPRAGKVVRIERKAAGITGQPRFCVIHSADMYGSCTGTRAPEAGEQMVALDRNRVIGAFRVTNVQAYADGCNQTSNWMIQGIADSGDFGAARELVLGVTDLEVDLRTARLIVADSTPTGHAWGIDTIYAIDTNGDSAPDVEFIQYACDDSGNAASMTATSQCHEVWAVRGKRGLERLRHDRFRACQ